MTNKLRAYFPMLRTRKEVQKIIQSNEELRQTFQSWNKKQRGQFLNICTGMRGRKILYDFMFKEILNPETVPERLEDLISCVLGQKVHIMEVLPNDNTHIADEDTLVTEDIVVQLEDLSIGNVEIQKRGYAFPGQRGACYSADLLLRQYKRVRSTKKEDFKYQDVRPVYTIVFFERSPKEFQAFKEQYLHRFEQTSDTGLKLELLQKFYFVPLDIFHEIYKNKDIKNKLEAWLWFLSKDEPEEIIRLVETYPEFKPLYNHIFDMCRNVEDVMGLFSEELRQLDRNTAQYMIDEMQEEIDKKDSLIGEQKATIEHLTAVADQAQQEKEQAQQEKEQAQREKEQAQQEREQAQQEREQAQREKDQAQQEIQEKDRLIQELQEKLKAVENEKKE